LVVAADPRTTPHEADNAKRIAYSLLAVGIQTRQVDVADILDLLPQEMFDYGRPV
jgi:hypothetical protein